MNYVNLCINPFQTENVVFYKVTYDLSISAGVIFSPRFARIHPVSEEFITDTLTVCSCRLASENGNI